MRKLEQRTVAGVSTQAVWEVLAQFGSVDKWAPGIYRCRLESGPTTGVGTRRIIRHRWGFRIIEAITEWNEGRGMSWVLLKAPFPMQEVLETWKVEEENGGAKITTTVSYKMGVGVFGAVLDQAFVRFIVAREMRRGLDALVAYIKEYHPPAESEYSPKMT